MDRSPRTQAVPLDEQHLLARLRSGDDDAFRELVEAHGGRLLAVARRITRDDSDAEDVLQEAFVSAFGKLADFDGRSRLSTWLHRIVVNTALMRLRARRSQPMRDIDALLPTFVDGHHEQTMPRWQPLAEDASAEAVRRERHDALWGALEQLPDGYREVVVMRDLEGMESKDVATQLGVRDDTVRQRLHRGRQALTRLLRPVMEDHPT
ncbi:MAG: RNA polymerase sigma factor [Planctomycetota bacterium]